MNTRFEDLQWTEPKTAGCPQGMRGARGLCGGPKTTEKQIREADIFNCLGYIRDMQNDYENVVARLRELSGEKEQHLRRSDKKIDTIIRANLFNLKDSMGFLKKELHKLIK